MLLLALLACRGDKAVDTDAPDDTPADTDTEPVDTIDTADSGEPVDPGPVEGNLCHLGPAAPLTGTPGDLGSVPAAGVHPRVLFDADHIEVLRERWKDDPYIEALIPGAYSNATNNTDLNAIIALDPDEDITEDDLDTLWTENEGRNISLFTLALHGEVYDDDELRQRAISGVVNLARLNLASQSLKSDHSVWTSEGWSLQVGWRVGGLGWAMSYDLLYNHLTEEQRAIVQEALVAVTTGRRAWGMGEPETRKLSNWAPYISGDLISMILTIEEVDGYDEEVFNLAADNIRQWLDYGLYEGGGALEDAYSLLALREGSSAMVALSRRGEDILEHPNYQAYIRHVAHSLEPALDGDYVGHSSGGTLNYPGFWAVARSAWPDDPVVGYLWRYYNGDDHTRNRRWQNYIVMQLFGFEGYRVDDWAETGLSRSWCDPRRGLLITRSDDTEEALYFHLDARPDAVFLGHDNADRGTFTLSALGRSFVPDDQWNDFLESTDHSLVHMDGQSQVLKAPAVRMLSANDDDTFVISRADLEYAYDWKWSKAWPSENEKYTDPWVEETTDPRDLGWPADDAWLPNSLYGHADVGFAGLWTGRAPHLPMTHALRSAVVARGEQPWVLITDDFAAEDGKSHTWDWQLHLEGDLSLVEQSGDDLVLAAEDDDRRLLVRVLQADDSGASWQASHETYTPDDLTAGRLHIETDTTEASFRILLVPHREGDSLPATTVNGTTITVTTGSGTDTVTVTHDSVTAVRE